MKKSYWLAVLAYVLPTFPLGYVWHLVAFGEAYERLALYRAEVIIPFGLVSMVVQALFFAWAYPRLFSTARANWAGNSWRAALAFGALSWSFTTVAVAAKYRMTSVPDFLALESAFTFVQFAVVGPLIALAHRDSPASSTAPLPSDNAQRTARASAPDLGSLGE